MLYRLTTFGLLAALAAAPVARAQDHCCDQVPGVGGAPVLDSIARLAVARNLGLQRAREREREADAGVRQARGLFLPSLGLDARYSALSGAVNLGDFINPAYSALNRLIGRDEFPTNIDATLPFKQETRLRSTLVLFNAALFANLDGARSIQSLRGAERDAAARQLDANARLAWLNWSSAARAVEIWDASIGVLDENLRVAQRLVDAGSSTPDAVLRARASLADAQQSRADAVRQRHAALGAFNLLLDQPLDAPAPVLPDESLPDAPDLALADALATSARREEHAMVTAAIRGADAQDRAAASAFLPSVAVAVDYGVQGNSYRFNREFDAATASVVLQWNLFNGGQDAARRQAASAARRGAEYQRADIDRQVALDVRTAWDAVRVAREAVAAAGTRLIAAQGAFTLVDRQYREGLTSYLEWSDARAKLTAAQLNRSLTRHALAARGVDLERAAALRNIPNN
jgi:outer membrane protein TolC